MVLQVDPVRDQVQELAALVRELEGPVVHLQELAGVLVLEPEPLLEQE